MVARSVDIFRGQLSSVMSMSINGTIVLSIVVQLTGSLVLVLAESQVLAPTYHTYITYYTDHCRRQQHCYPSCLFLKSGAHKNSPSLLITPP